MSDSAQERRDGPYLSAALLCEKVLVEQDGVKSAIRIIDRVTRTVAGPAPPQEMEPFDHALTLLLILKAGWARGSFPLQITLIKPSGESPAPFQQTIHFEGEEDRGVDVLVNLKISLELSGIYWLEIHLSEQLLTRVPFRVIYLPQVTQTHGSGGA